MRPMGHPPESRQRLKHTRAALERLVLTAATWTAACVTGPSAERGTAPPLLPPGVRAHEAEVRYDVRGLTDRAIAASLAREARRVTGSRFRGRHDWRIRWEYRYAADDVAGCAITTSAVHLESTTVLPRWVDRVHADSDLITKWDRYIAALREHEEGHRDRAYRAAAEIQRALRRLRTSSCTLMAAEANRVAQDLLRRHRRQQADYDRETNHGATQGAGWRVGEGRRPRGRGRSSPSWPKFT